MWLDNNCPITPCNQWPHWYHLKKIKICSSHIQTFAFIFFTSQVLQRFYSFIFEHHFKSSKSYLTLIWAHTHIILYLQLVRHTQCGALPHNTWMTVVADTRVSLTSLYKMFDVFPLTVGNVRNKMQTLTLCATSYIEEAPAGREMKRDILVTFLRN